MSNARLSLPVWFRRRRDVALAVLLCLLVAGLSLPLNVAADNPEPYVEAVFELKDGRIVERRVCPLPPPDQSMPAMTGSLEVVEAGATLSDVPVFDWSNGCSATAAAMLFGYYDRTGYPDMYTGPANGGVCPLNNETEWTSGVTPLSATRQGYDDLTVKGHVDDYWSQTGSTDDPYFGNWDEHGYADCTADFMGTNQYENWNNTDGSTTFVFPTDGAPLYDYSGSEDGSTPYRDGCHGMRLFAESRGYEVVTNYNQRIEGYDGNTGGYSLAQFQQMIDSGQPVIIQVHGHSMLGVGYDSSSSTIYVHDTWDHDVHSMTWGGSYAGMGHYGVTVIELAAATDAPLAATDAATSVEETTATLHGSIADDGGATCQWQFSYGTAQGSYDVSTGWTGSLGSGEDFQYGLTELAKGRTYYFTAEARNGYGLSSGVERQFTTKPDAPSGLTAIAPGTDSIELGWTPGEGAQKTKLQRKADGYPTGPSDGTTVHFDVGASATDTGLEPDTTYYYSAWSYVEGSEMWSDEHAEAQATTDGLPYPELTTDASTSITDTSVQLNGTLTDDGGETCAYRFEYDLDSGELYEFSTPWASGVTTGQAFNEVVDMLEPGTTYYYRAQAENSVGVSGGEEVSFTTKPTIPSGLSATATSSQSIDLSWRSGQGSTETLIMRKIGVYPADRTDGEQAYLGPDEAFNDTGLQPGTEYYYRAWSHAVPGDQWCDGCADASAQTEPVEVSVPVVDMPSGGSSMVPVTVNAAVDLASVSLSLQFDPSIVEISSFESGDMGEVGHGSLAEANSSGQLTLSWSSATGLAGDFTLATVTFAGVGIAGDTTGLDLGVSAFSDSSGDSVVHSIVDGSIALVALMEGDVNNDGATNIVDAMVIAQYTVGSRTLDETQLLSADTNDDGDVNIVDAMHIAQYTVDPIGSGGVLFKPLWESPADDNMLEPEV